MAFKTMGETISSLRREKGFTQKELADKLNVTDKAVSKWERDLSCPDISSLPKLAEVLGISVDELINAPAKAKDNTETDKLINLILKAIPLAMGIAVIVLSVLKKINVSSGMGMLGVAVLSIAIYLFKNK